LEEYDESERDDEGETAASTTLVTAALVTKTSVETWVKVKELLQQSGSRIVFQRLAPRQTFLWIEER